MRPPCPDSLLASTASRPHPPRRLNHLCQHQLLFPHHRRRWLYKWGAGRGDDIGFSKDFVTSAQSQWCSKAILLSVIFHFILIHQTASTTSFKTSYSLRTTYGYAWTRGPVCGATLFCFWQENNLLLCLHPTYYLNHLQSQHLHF